MKNLDSEVIELVKLHNDFLESRDNDTSTGENQFFLPEGKRGSVLTTVNRRLQGFAFMYLALIVVFFTASFLIVNSVVRPDVKNVYTGTNSEIFKAEQRGGIVYAFNEARK